LWRSPYLQQWAREVTDALMGREEFADVEGACLAALRGERALIPWRGRRASSVMRSVEAVLTDRGWLSAISAFADRDGIQISLGASSTPD
jgi:hypothetical protein